MGEAKNEDKWLRLLKEKYEKAGQNLDAHLEGLYHARYITYWDYVHLDTLLSLQNPRTHFPDEPIFIMYHQVTELYFKLALEEYRQLAGIKDISKNIFIQKLSRINRYFDCLSQSFNVMTEGMELEQYLQFRLTLTPASGYQSYQYREIEIRSTKLNQLVDKRYRDQMQNETDEAKLIEKIYWKAAGIDHETGKKTLTLQLFEEKYLDKLIATAKSVKKNNIYAIFNSLPNELRSDTEIVKAMRQLDHNVNVKWPLAHFNTAARYLQTDSSDIEATGGSDWRKYMHPKYQRRMFFPALWSSDELENWGTF